MDIVALSKELMKNQTDINKVPAWLLTQIAIKKWKELSKKYGENEDLVLISLYLSHMVFSPIWKWEIQSNHPELSAEFSKDYLDKWGVNTDDQKIILNAIQAHHNKIATESKIAEIVKNAECFKFVTVEWSLIWLHELGIRQVPFEEAVDKVIQKMEQKKKLLTLEECILDAEKNCKDIMRLFSWAIK